MKRKVMCSFVTGTLVLGLAVTGDAFGFGKKSDSEYAAETKELMGEDWLNACTYEGELYCIPTDKPIALTPMIIYRADIAEKLGIDMTAVNSIDDVTAVLEAVKEGKPDMTPMSPVEAVQKYLVEGVVIGAVKG